SFSVHAQLSLNWITNGVVAPTYGNSTMFGVACDGSGNVITCGNLRSNVDFGLGPISGPNNGDIEAFLVKYNSAGVPQWNKGFISPPNSGNNAARKVATDSGNNIIVVGGFTRSVDFGGTTLTGVQTATGFPIAGFIAKYNSGGTLQWAVKYGNTNV